ncbi:MAG: hypothetical protein EOP06_00365 [Proteobacteria bacterium]|nr:MAG: hypothetical protein EOP06_00365 [Pseudomonadota bacterium]
MLDLSYEIYHAGKRYAASILSDSALDRAIYYLAGFAAYAWATHPHNAERAWALFTVETCDHSADLEAAEDILTTTAYGWHGASQRVMSLMGTQEAIEALQKIM